MKNKEIFFKFYKRFSNVISVNCVSDNINCNYKQKGEQKTTITHYVKISQTINNTTSWFMKANMEKLLINIRYFEATRYVSDQFLYGFFYGKNGGGIFFVEKKMFSSAQRIPIVVPNCKIKRKNIWLVNFIEIKTSEDTQKRETLNF